MGKILVIFGYLEDTSPNAYIFNELDSLIVSIYTPLLTGNIKRDKICIFGEKNPNMILWPFKILSRTLRFLYLIKKNKISLVVTQFDQASMSILPTLFLSRLFRRKVKFFTFLHSGIEEYDGKEFDYRFARFFVKNFYKYFDKIITVSKGNKKKLEEKFGLKNLDYAYNPMSSKYARQRAKEKINLKKIVNKKNPFVFISVGRLVEQKCYWSMIRSFKRVADKNKNAVLIILGTGPHENKLKEMIKDMELEENVFLLGFKKNVFPYLASSDCFVLPSLWESFGNVITEALALNKMVVSTDCSGPREILAPEISISKKIKYPYYGKYGILTGVFKREYNWESVSDVPLDSIEKNFSDLLLSLSKKKVNKYKNVKKRADDFSLEKISKDYMKIFKI